MVTNQEEPRAVVIIYQLHVLLVLSTKEDLMAAYGMHQRRQQLSAKLSNFKVGNKSDHAHNRSDLWLSHNYQL